MFNNSRLSYHQCPYWAGSLAKLSPPFHIEYSFPWHGTIGSKLLRLVCVGKRIYREMRSQVRLYSNGT